MMTRRGTAATLVLTGVLMGAPGSPANSIGAPASPASHGSHGSAPLSRVRGGLNTRTGWAGALLRGVGAPVTSCNMSAVLEWMAREGGGFGNQASFNPLNLNPGSSATWPGHPAIGAWAFNDPQTGLGYTIATLKNYGGIMAALQAGNSAQNVMNQIQASPWAASHYGGSLAANC